MRSILCQSAVLLLLVVGLSAARVAPRWNQLDGYTFEAYVRHFTKGYTKGTAEWSTREANFLATMKIIRAHNQDSTQTFKMGVNQFTDWSVEERLQNNRAIRVPASPSRPMAVHAVPTGTQPRYSVDWRTAQPPVLTAIKNQGGCGDCYSHAATQAMESAYALMTGELHVLSQQQGTSCTNQTGCWTYKGQQYGGGCSGGLAENVIDYVRDFGGIYSVWQYPFTDIFSSNGSTAACRAPLPHHQAWLYAPVVNVEGYVHVKPNDALSAMHALEHNGPLVTYVASLFWNLYETGVFSNMNVTGFNYSHNFRTDHAVQLVGYGHDDDVDLDYWVVRNTWGAAWGEAGYIRLNRPKKEPCGLDSPWDLSCNDHPFRDARPVCGTSGVLSQPLYAIAAEVNTTKWGA